MNTYIVSFELRSQKKRSLEYAITSIASDYCELHANAWLFTSNRDIKNIKDILLSSISNNDRIFFSKVSAPYDALLEAKAIDYIKARKLV
ncbi:hypothetical protein EP56_03840 [Listeriaceae bacterium FSL A5-0209]|nr:hypothetical protein EP56_03840 [Listeriaceae bacterium FSL A5-0209]